MLVSVVDDDDSVRETVPDLLREFGFEAQAYSSAKAVPNSDQVERTGCPFLDVSMPGPTGGLEPKLQRCSFDLPVVFIAAHAEWAARSDVVAGTPPCLTKPCHRYTRAR